MLIPRNNVLKRSTLSDNEVTWLPVEGTTDSLRRQNPQTYLGNDVTESHNLIGVSTKKSVCENVVISMLNMYYKLGSHLTRPCKLSIHKIETVVVVRAQKV